MMLKNIYIRKTEAYEQPAGAYVGKIEYVGKMGEVSINLDAEKIAKILPIVAEAMTEATRKVAATLTSEIIEQVNKALPAPSAQTEPTNPDDPF